MQERHHKNIVCYTEDKSGWPDMITGIFNAYDFDVNHFETNSEAWDNPDIGIENNPSLYDVYVLDQDTECSLDGSELIEMILALPFDPNRKILIIILSSSNRDLFTREDIQVLKQKHNVQLCWKSNTYALQAAYARDKLDHWDEVGSFDDWLLSTKGIGLDDDSRNSKISKANDKVQSQVWNRPK